MNGRPTIAELPRLGHRYYVSGLTAGAVKG
jgi:hypothetical protein